MASAQPSVDVPKRLPLVTEPANRSTSTDKDGRLVNAFVETKGSGQEAETWLFRRPGLLENATYSETGNGQGIYNWRGDIYTVFGTDIFKNGASIGTVDSSNGVYRFSQTLGTTQNLVLGNGVKAYTWDGASLTDIGGGDPDFPSSFVKGWAYLDATLYVMNATANIFGSELNLPLDWDPLNVLVAQIEPDGGVALSKQLVYVIAFKQWSTEVFYDAANAAGSPLGTVQGAKLNYGCANQDSVQELDGALLWAATNRAGSVQILMLDNLKADPVSTKPVERLLKSVDFNQTIYSWTFKSEGHAFYILTSPSANLTLAYDTKEHLWAQWTDVAGNYLPIIASCAIGNAGAHLVQHATNGKVYNADLSYKNDNGEIITVDIFPPLFDGGTLRRKLLSGLTVVGDMDPGSVIQIRHNDSDYRKPKWSPWRNIRMDGSLPGISDLGTFVRRGMQLRHACNTNFRIQAVELQIDIGTL